jgi:rSAM/selenodomain-associated transferase 1
VEKAAGSPVKRKILLIFAKEPRAGDAKTRLCPPLTPAQAATLYAAMIQDVLALTVDLPEVERWLCYTPGPMAAAYFEGSAAGLHLHAQEGTDLGARLVHAFAAAFAAGASQVAVIGTDAPDLPPAFIEQCFAHLTASTTDAVFGPSLDGGYYLLGLDREQPCLFTDIPWSSTSVLATSLQRADSARIRTALLPPWNDLDTVADLKLFVQNETAGGSQTRIQLQHLLTITEHA